MKFRVKSLSNISMAALMLSGSRVPGYRKTLDLHLHKVGLMQLVNLIEMYILLVDWLHSEEE